MNGLAPAARSGAVEPPGSRQNNVGAIRLLLAFLVLVSHAPELVDGNRSRELLTRVFHTLSFGEFGVDGFFLLSGALITASFLGSRSPAAYLGKRVLHIFPGYLVAALFCLVVVAPVVGGTVEWRSAAFWQHAVMRCLFLASPEVPGAMKGNHYPSLNGSMWTIHYEFGAYLVVLLLGVLGVLRRRQIILAGAALLIVAAPVLGSAVFAGWREALGVHRSAVENWIRFLGLFASGAAFHLYRHRLVYSGRWAAVATLVLVLSLLSPSAAHVGMATAGAYLLFFAGLHLRSKRLSRVGTRNDLSYGVYLYAWPVQSALVWYWPGVSLWTLLVFSAGLSSVLAWLSWLGVERPALRLKPASGRRPAPGRPMSAELR